MSIGQIGANFASDLVSAGRKFLPLDPQQLLPTIQKLLTQGLPPTQQGSVLRALDRLATMGADALQNAGELAGTVRDALTSLPNDAANALADSMRGPSARGLTSGETAALRRAFGNSIDVSNVRIVNGPGYNPDAAIAFHVGKNPAITEGNTVYIASTGYAGDLSLTPKKIKMLIHEFTHVRQFQQMGFGDFYTKYTSDLIDIADRNLVYRYDTRSRTFNSETLEGQAQMIGDYAEWRAGGNSRDEKVNNIEKKIAGTGLFGL